jgi:hypothetical protein
MGAEGTWKDNLAGGLVCCSPAGCSEYAGLENCIATSGKFFAVVLPGLGGLAVAVHQYIGFAFTSLDVMREAGMLYVGEGVLKAPRRAVLSAGNVYI